MNQYFESVGIYNPTITVNKFQSNTVFLPRSLVTDSIAGSLCKWEVECLASDPDGLNFGDIQCRLTHLMAQFSLMHRHGIKYHFFQHVRSL